VKWLVIVLALCNAGYLAWGVMDPGKSPAAPRPPATAPAAIAPRPLVLLAEVPAPMTVPAEAPPSLPAESPPPTVAVPAVAAAAIAEEVAPNAGPAPAEPPPAAAAPQRVCYEIAGIEKRSDFEVLKSQLLKAGTTLVGEGERQISRQTFWVMLPPFGSAGAAEAVVAKLARQRAGDFYMVKTGEFANAISLGIFSTKEAAQRRVAQIRALPIKTRAPRIEAIELPAKRHWIAFSASDPAPEVPLPDPAARTKVSCNPPR
jgi:hypothetical protein